MQCFNKNLIQSSPLILFGIFFISIDRPVLFPGISTDLWFTNQENVQVLELAQGTQIRAKKEGLFFSTGLDANNPKVLQKWRALSEKNFLALKKCPDEKINWLESGIPLIAENGDLQKITECEFENLGIHEDLKIKIHNEILTKEEELRKNGLSFTKAYWNEENQRVLSLKSLEKQKTIQKELGLFNVFYKFENSNNLIFPGNTLVFDLQIYEVSKRDLQQIGFEQKEFKLDWKNQRGIGKIITRPKIRTRPGEKALFKSGGELPYISSQSKMSTINWRSYGLTIEILPEKTLQSPQTEISFDLKLSLSEPDPSTAIDGLPGMLHRSFESKIDLRIQEQTFLTSLEFTKNSTSSEGLWGILFLSFIGDLFGWHKDQNATSELWFAVYTDWENLKI